jgi:hypothetical protein
MSSSEALTLLRRSDPALRLEPVSTQAREILRDRIMVLPAPSPHMPRDRRRPRRLAHLALAAVTVLVVGVGAAWAAGVLSPLAVFEQNAQRDGNPPGSIWDQSVAPATVRRAASVSIPEVGAVGFWYAETTRGGWCGALRLPDGNWLGTGKGPLDAGGTVPGCYPTREAVNAAARSPVYVLNGFDYQEDDVDARPVGGSFWRIRFGRIDAPGAVRIVDRVSGESAGVERGLFELAVADPDPAAGGGVHLVALSADGKVVADDCPSCNP